MIRALAEQTNGICEGDDCYNLLRKDIDGRIVKCSRHRQGGIGIDVHFTEIPARPGYHQKKIAYVVLHVSQGNDVRLCRNCLQGKHPQILQILTGPNEPFS